MIRTIVSIALCLTVSACGLSGHVGRPAPPLGASVPAIMAGASMPGALEPIYAAAASADQAVFRVTSNGCTQKSDILPVVRRFGDSALITLRRVKDDRCTDVQEEGVDVIYSLEELGLSPADRIEINNPYLMGPEDDAAG